MKGSYGKKRSKLRERDRKRSLERYSYALKHLKPSGGGGCHVDMLRVANLGRAAGVSEEQVFNDLRAHVKGTRRVDDSEIADRVRTAYHSKYTPKKRSKPMIVDGTKSRAKYISRGLNLLGATKYVTAIEQLERLSPVKVAGHDGTRQIMLLLSHLFEHDDQVFVGNVWDNGRDSVKRVSRWADHFKTSCLTTDYQFFVINPLTGSQGRTKSGCESYRADDCVADFRYTLAEFDSLPLIEQLAFWCGFPAPIASLTYTAGKSIHATLAVNSSDREAWERDVEDHLHQGILIPLGMDKTTFTEAHLSRTPGCYRPEKGRWQQLLYLNPEPSAKGISGE